LNLIYQLLAPTTGKRTVVQWKLSEEQTAYRDAFRGWLQSVTSSGQVREWLDARDPSVFEGRFVADGWAGVGFEEEFGGQGGGLVELAITAEELARVAAPSAGWLMTVLSLPAFVGRSDLVEAATGGSHVGICVSAEKPIDDAPALRRDADGAITGAVPRVLGADRADWLLVVVEHDGDRSLHVVDAHADGVATSAHELLDRSRSVADVQLAGVVSELLEVDCDEFLRTASARAAVLVAADTLGATDRMLEMSVEYSLQRRQFGVQIGSFQAVKHGAATMLVGVEAARSVVYFAAASVDGQEEGADLHAAAAKAQVTAEGARAADSALTIHGAIGYTWEHDLQLFFKRALLDQQLFGSPVLWNERIAAGLALL
jgi:alkylation response protein AidB-like acyl-CoA dehydrogenase